MCTETKVVKLLECGSCGQYHPEGTPAHIDCRVDDWRYSGIEDYAHRNGVHRDTVVEVEYGHCNNCGEQSEGYEDTDFCLTCENILTDENCNPLDLAALEILEAGFTQNPDMTGADLRTVQAAIKKAKGEV